MSGRPRIISDPSILLGKPCVAGTRISVEHILRDWLPGRLQLSWSRTIRD